MEWVKEYWFLIWASVLTLAQVGNLLLTKTFVRKEDITEMRRDVDNLKTKIEHMPSSEEVTQLRVSLESTRGEIKALQPQLDQIKNLTQVLLEQHLDH